MIEVLVVDDDTDLLEMVNLVLANEDMQVNCLDSGVTFFDVISVRRPDIILMDIFIGDSDGRVLCRTLKTSEKFNNIPVILYSAGNITSSSIESSLADDFLTKPFDISNLVKKIKSFI